MRISSGAVHCNGLDLLSAHASASIGKAPVAAARACLVCHCSSKIMGMRLEVVQGRCNAGRLDVNTCCASAGCSRPL